jgi:peptidoglycan/LPS O-acetylase OafA/YrhL
MATNAIVKDNPVEAGSASPVKAPQAERHLRSLDGLRAISITLVLLGHIWGTRNAPKMELGVGDYAHLGVVVFFVISGFLITTLLLAEHEKTGTVSLKLFYARRALRIFPASYTYIACVFLLWLLGTYQWGADNFWYAVTYTVNYVTHPCWQLGHLWSLSIEEQFYLLWPLAFFLLKPKKGLWFAGAVVLLGPVARMIGWFFLHATPYRDLPIFPLVADSLATGCVLANAKGWLEQQRWYLRLFHPVAALSLVALILATNRFLGYTVVHVFGTSVINICIAILIHRSVYDSRDWVGQFLNWKPVAFVGVLSYSLYLWQQLLLDRKSTAWVNAFPQNLLFAVGAALASYLLLEKPLLRLRHRLRT